MADSPFARCQRFLDYHPLAKWFSIVSSILTAILYIGLLVLLVVFLDLMVDRGEIPGFHQLPSYEQRRFLAEVAQADEAEIRRVHEELKGMGFDPAQVRTWAKGEPIENWSPRARALVWWAELPRVLESRVGAAAADKMREDLRHAVEANGVEAAAHQPLPNTGILGLVVRTRWSTKHTLIGFAASWNDWTWAYGNSVFLVGLLVTALALAVLRVVLMFLSNYLGALAVIEAVTRFRRAVYQQTSRLGTLAFRALGPSEAVSISTRHLQGIHDGLYQWLTVCYRDSVKFGLLLLFTFLINFWLAVAFLLFALLVWLVGGQTAAYFRRRGRVAEMAAADQLVLLQESLTLMRLIKVYLMETFNLTRVERQLADHAQAQRALYRGEAIYLPLFFFLGLTAGLILCFVAALVVLSDQLSVTSTLILAAAILSMYWPTLALLEARRMVRRMRQSAKTLFEFLDRHGGVGQAIEAEFIPSLEKALVFDRVSLKEPGTGRTLLTKISFTIRAGEKIAVVGPDDMEKHALVYLLPRFLDPSSGEIRIDGKDLRWVTLESLRAQIAMVLQHNLVFNDTVANNIGCGDPSFTTPRIIEAAKIAHVHQFIMKLPDGYETAIGDMGHSLKLGEMFRIALARAILRDPAILVIEEPETQMDEDTKAMIDDTLQRVLPGRTVIFLAHRLSTIRTCDRVMLLYQGQIEASGEHRELLNSSDLYKHLQYLEFNEYASLLAPPTSLPRDNEEG